MAEDIGEVRDLSHQHSRDLARWGRTLIRHRTFRSRSWTVAEPYDEVKRRIAGENRKEPHADAD